MKPNTKYKFFDHFSDYFCEMDSNGKILDVNSTWLKEMEWNEEELMGKIFFELLHPEEMISFMLFDLTGKGIEARCKMKNGKFRWVLWSAWREEKEGNLFILGRDIEERKIREESYRERSRALSLTIEEASMGVCFIGVDGKIKKVNKKLKELTRKSEKELTEQPISVIASEGEEEELIHYIQGRMAGRPYATSWERKLKRKNNDYFWGLLSAHPVKDADGKPLYLFVAIQDITPQKRAEEVIRDQEMKIMQSSRLASLGEMSAGIAHEVNNPLTIINAKSILLSRMLKEEGEFDRKTALTHLDLIQNTTKRMSKVIEGMRAISRNGEGDPFESVPISKIIEDAVALCIGRVEDESIKLMIDKVETSASIECRPAQLVQVLLNMISNACDAIAELPEKWVRINVSDLELGVEIKITDSGKGIPKEIAKNILRPFFTTKPTGKGTGLGLSISMDIIKQHRGDLRIDDKSPNTCFILKFPASQSQLKMVA